MRKNILCIISCLLCLIGCKQSMHAPIPDGRVNDYALYDDQGGFHRLSTYNDSKAIVLFVQGNGCPIVRNALRDFRNIVDDYKPQGITFFMVNSNIQDTRNSIKNEAQDFKFNVPVLHDNAQLLADALDIKITAEAILLHPVSREIIFRGPLNNRLDYESQKSKPTETYLRDALDAILTNQTPISKQEMTRGCKVTRRHTIEKDTLTYTKDIATILKNQCTICHKDGGVAPWSMTDYEKIVGWSAMIEQVMLSQRMPPWKADPLVGSYTNSFALAESDRRKIVNWIKKGMIYGDGNDPLKEAYNSEIIETTRQPDTIITLKKQVIPATGILEYRHQEIDLNLPNDKWIAGFTIAPSNPKVVHHSIISSNLDADLAIHRKSKPWIDNLIAIYASGAFKHNLFPENSGVFLEKKNKLILQTHYITTGKEEENTTKVKIYYHKEKPQKQYFSLGIFSEDITIDPYKKINPVTAEDKITEDIYLHSIGPHMHYRGKQMKVKAIQPNGEELVLLSVPDYSFNWQYLYMMEKPIFLPKGTIIKADGYYDNSFQNPLNPDPSKKVTYGDQSTDEMFIAFVNYTLAKE